MTNQANIGGLSPLRPGQLAFFRQINANWASVDKQVPFADVFESANPAFSCSIGDIIAFDASGRLALALDDSASPVSQKMAIGWAKTPLTGVGQVTIQMFGDLHSAGVLGSPSPGDVVFLSRNTAGKLSATKGVNPIPLGIYQGGDTVWFMPYAGDGII